MSEDRPTFVVARLVLTVAMVLVGAIGAVRGATAVIEHTVPMHDRMTLGQLHRVAKALVAADDKVGNAALIGTSRTMLGFDPRVFDATLASAGHPMTTLNFGMIPITETSAIALACRLRPALLIYELAPEDWMIDLSSPDRDGAAQFDEAVQTMTGPTGMALGYRAPFAVASGLHKYIYVDAFEHGIPAWLAGSQRFMDHYRPGDASTWDDPTHGFIPITSPETLEIYNDYLRVQANQASLDRQRAAAVENGTTMMLPSPTDLARAIAQVRAVGRCADRTILLVYPLRPTVVSTVLPQARARLRATLATIHDATGYEIIDLFDEPMFGTDVFQDAVHLSVTRGAPMFSRELALRVLKLQ